MADFDVAAHNFMMNTMKGSGTGGGIGSGASNEMQGAFGGSAFGYNGVESLQKKIQAAPGVGGKLFEGLVANVTQGFAQSASLQNLGFLKATGMDGVSPLGINVAQKVPGLFSSKG